MNVSLRDFLGGDCEGFSGQKDCLRLSWTSDIVCLNILGFGGFFLFRSLCPRLYLDGFLSRPSAMSITAAY